MQQITVPKTKVKENIRKFVYQIRKKASLDKQLYFPIVEYMENALGTIDNDFTLDVCPDNELPGILAEACPELHTIKVRQTVYDGACLGHYWHRMTLFLSLVKQCIFCKSGSRRKNTNLTRSRSSSGYICGGTFDATTVNSKYELS